MKQKYGTPRDCSVWVFDENGDFSSQMNHALGSSYKLRCFSQLEPMIENLRSMEPSMIIARIDGDPHTLTKIVLGSSGKPIIAVSSVKDANLIRHSLEAGATDCLIEPIDPEILSAKIQALVKRDVAIGVLPAGLAFDPFAQTISDPHGHRIKLTRKEFKILEIIGRAGEQGVSPKEIRLQIWGDCKVVSKSLDVHLFNIRGKLEPLGRSVRFRGGRYCLLKEEDV